MAGAPAFARPAATGADRLQSRFRRGGPGPAPMTPTAKSAPRPPKPWTDAPRLALRLLLTLIAMLSVAAQPVLAQSLLRDAETERSEEHTSEIQSLMRISSAVFCLTKNKNT